MYTGADILQSNAGGCKRILNCRIVAAAGLDCILGWMSKEACCNELQYPISASNVSRHSYGRALVAFFYSAFDTAGFRCQNRGATDHVHRCRHVAVQGWGTQTLAVQKTERNQSKLVVCVRGPEPRTLNRSKDHHSSTLWAPAASPAANC